MSAPLDAGLEHHYEAIERRFRVTSSGDYSSLVIPNGNAQEPVHRWFHLKEAFSHRLLGRVIKDIEFGGLRSLRLFDPFSGAGTSAVSAAQLVQNHEIERTFVTAVETNPFLHFLTCAKFLGATRECASLLAPAGAIAAQVVSGGVPAGPEPTLSTFGHSDYFSPAHLERLLQIKAAIDLRAARLEPPASLFLQVALAAAIEPSSGLRRDGRTLRFVPGKLRADPLDTFLAIAERVDSDLSRRDVEASGQIVRADVRALNEAPGHGGFDLALFSPPYPNNIDYTEVYKLESWLLGFIDSQESFTSQRWRTLRSHGSLKWHDVYQYQTTDDRDRFESLLAPVEAVIPEDRYKSARIQLVRGYADDMARVLRLASSSLRPGGYVVCIVGNSLHGHPGRQLLVASDLIIATLAEWSGLDVCRIEVARVPTRKRTASRFLRESVIFARRPREFG